ncbi:flippase-like domain-containing protein [Chitinophagales bacterium]|nr:flippase-like domain-containing protein [Chitinophagales bacterium]
MNERSKHINFRKSAFQIAIKVAILLLLLLAFYWKGSHSGKQLIDWDQIRSLLQEGTWMYLLLAVALAPVNWLLEAKKWQLLLSKVHAIGWYQSIKNVFAGFAIGMFTPNRIGEAVGRVAEIPAEKRKAALGLSFLSSYAQLVASTTLGLLAFLVWNWEYNLLPYQLIYVAIGVVYLIALFALVKSAARISTWLPKLKWEWLAKQLQPILNSFSDRELPVGKAIALSAVRYVVFCFQLLLMIWGLGGDLGLSTGMLTVASVFFLQSIAPSIALLELGIRASFLILLAGQLGVPEGIAIAASFLLWSLNLVLPSLAGAILYERNREK